MRQAGVVGTTFSILSALIALLWIHGFFHYDAADLRLPLGNDLRISSGSGHVMLFLRNGIPPGLPAIPVRFVVHPAPPDDRFARQLQAVFNFEFMDQILSVPGSGVPTGKIHVRGLSFPIWVPLVISTTLLVITFYLNRDKSRWHLRNDVEWINLRLKYRVCRFAKFSMLGIATGALVGWIDQYCTLVSTPWQWIVAGLILLPGVSALIVITRRRIPWTKAMLWMALETAGCFCFFDATFEQVRHFLSTIGFADPGLLEQVLLLGLFSFLLNSVLLLIIQLRREPLKPGPYCPECEYCLIGVPTSSKQICPECGRPFTFEELGITEAELLVPIKAN